MKKLLKALISIIIVTSVLLLVIRIFDLQLVRVNGHSMYPTLIENDFVLVLHNESFELETPTRTGYKFIGWSFDNVFYTDKNGNSIKTFDETFNVVTLTANWSEILKS